MERRYLVAALAIIATFAVVSHGFRFLEHYSSMHIPAMGPMAKGDCLPKRAARAIAKVRTHLRPASPEEAQLLAEMNVPIPSLAQQVAEERAIAKCARSQASAAVRAQREMVRMQRDLRNNSVKIAINPMSIDVDTSPNFDQRIHAEAEAAARAAEANINSNIAQKLQESSAQIANAEAMAAMFSEVPPMPAVHVVTHVHFRGNATQQSVQQSVRDALRQAQSSFVAK